MLPRPWDSPGKNTGVGCHFLLQCMKVKRESEVAQSCLTLQDPMDCSLPGSSVHGIFQAKVLEWGAIALCSIFLWWVFFFFFFPPIPSCFDDCSFIVQSEVKDPDSSSSVFCFFSQDCFGYLGIFGVSIQIANCFCSNSVKNALSNLIGIALNL